MLRYYSVYKPFRVMCQFSPVPGKQTLADIFDLPRDVYPVGRLDYDSEGLLLLTNDGQLNRRLLHPAERHERAYRVQVEGVPTAGALHQLEQGVTIHLDGKPYHTLPARAEIFSVRPAVAERHPPIRYRKSVPDTWISLTLHEGKNRQVRRMTAAVGYPTLRLIRYRIGGLELGDMQPGDVREWERGPFFRLLFGA
ncbi:pseudouridine synthase [Compostibacter hankyongensis]|uniref:Pseudouridine synthase n=1 Tax=Compostibacter hankyongensis TaxID=1007089 RepID=A0ABP8G0I6_9BACT